MRRLLVAAVLTGLCVRPACGQIAMPPLPQIPQGPQTQPLMPGAVPNGQPNATSPLLPGAAAPNSPFPAKMSIIDPRGVEVRSGPTAEYYATSRLKYGDAVIVLRESKDQPGWYAIAPPPGSFSWVDGKYVKPVDSRTGYVEAEGNGAVPVLPGSTLLNKEPNVESTKIASGFQVTLLDRPMETNGRKWYPILPPPSEVRFIPKEAVQPQQSSSVTPPNWSRTNQGEQPNLPGYPQTSSWTMPGQVAVNQTQGTVGTPASFSQLASPWTPFNGVSTQPPQWSQWGKLRRTAFDKDGQPMFVLEDRAGKPLMYVASSSGTSLRNYVDQLVCLYGSISYRSDGYQRTYYMMASHVATP